MQFRRSYTLALSLLAGTVAVCSALPSPAEAGQKALLIGIGAYQNIRPLIGPPQDLVRMEQFLKEHMGYRTDEIAVLKDSQATRKHLLRTMNNWLIRSTKAGDKVFIYYSGHGSQLAAVSRHAEGETVSADLATCGLHGLHARVVDLHAGDFTILDDVDPGR